MKFLCAGLPKVNTEWTKWKIFFCDERVVAFDDPESTYGLYKRGLHGKVPITTNQLIAINPSLSLKEIADDYTSQLKLHFPGEELPRFDLLLLGMGPDGHTCSLFPGHKALQVTSTWITEINDSPKPPPQRITLTLPVINNSRKCVFVSTGENKAEVLKKILEGNEPNPLPAALVKPSDGELVWILDKGAASLLNSK